MVVAGPELEEEVSQDQVGAVVEGVVDVGVGEEKEGFSLLPTSPSSSISSSSSDG